MKLIKYMLLFVFLALFFFCIWGGCLQIIYIQFSQFADGELITMPDNHIEQTAEYLYYNPLPLPPEITHILGGINSPVCAYGDFAKAFWWVTWIINGSKIPYSMVSAGIGGDIDHSYFNSCVQFDFFSEFTQGFHLIEIYWQTNQFDPGKSYQFGVNANDPFATPLPIYILSTPQK